MAAAGNFSRPPLGVFVAAYGEILMAADKVPASRKERYCCSGRRQCGGHRLARVHPDITRAERCREHSAAAAGS